MDFDWGKPFSNLRDDLWRQCIEELESTIIRGIGIPAGIFRGQAMTELDWLTSADPSAMLEWAANRERKQSVSKKSGIWGMWPPMSDRKFRLFACACLWAAGRKYEWMNVLEEKGKTHGLSDFRWAEMWARMGGDEVPDATRAALLRDIVGNPFAPVTLPQEVVGTERVRSTRRIPRGAHPMVPDSGYYTKKTYGCPWLTPSVVNMALAIYEDRAWDHLPILADALEEVGCVGPLCEYCQGKGCIAAGDKTHIPRPASWHWNGCNHGYTHNPLLVHLRGPGPHCRGCHVIDLLTGRG